MDWQPVPPADSKELMTVLGDVQLAPKISKRDDGFVYPSKDDETLDRDIRTSPAFKRDDVIGDPCEEGDKTLYKDGQNMLKE